MKSLTEIDKNNLEEIKEQITIREKFINEMVGRLYPSILWGEIQQLETWKHDAGIKRGNVGFEK